MVRAMRARTASITDLPMSPDEERQRRFRTYLWMMVVRVVCLVVFFIVPDWWKLVPALGAIFIPYFAVVMASQTVHHDVEHREVPNALPAAPTQRPAPPTVDPGPR